MHDDLSLEEIKKEWHGTLKSYVIGFIASLLLTAAFLFSSRHRIVSRANLNLYDCRLWLLSKRCSVAIFLARRTRSTSRAGKQCFLFYGIGFTHHCHRVTLDYA